ncbi:cytochrome c peroxidase [Rapidithrix thailandica]|uniref:Cytochrome c peroxidase n=1 Tax=Rapidithrix thailandica TaxID=413964 RepID=A0AAW9S7C4_9BACT
MQTKIYFITLLTSLVGISFYQCSSSDSEKETPNPKPLLDYPEYFGNSFLIPEDNPTDLSRVELGRMLFYEKKLSGDNSMSCASCHQQKQAFTDGKQFSTGIDGIKGSKNAMSIVNLLWQRKFFWNGRANSLEEQALIPIQDPIEMHQSLEGAINKLQGTELYPAKFKEAFGSETITAENIAKALAQFERTLISHNSKYDQYLKGTYKPTEEELLGINLFFTHPIPEIGLRGGNCGDCHLGALTSGDINDFQGFHNNGLDGETDLAPGLMTVTQQTYDRGKFKAPSLRNIALTAPYMHDGRFQSLEDVLEHYDEHIIKSETLDPLILEASNEPIHPGEPVKLFLTEKEKKAILAFLQMLTDHEFINDERFSNPFTK